MSVKCSYPDCGADADHLHHVTYQPVVIKPLCRPHHEEITIINGQQARKNRRFGDWRNNKYVKLSNKYRWWI